MLSDRNCKAIIDLLLKGLSINDVAFVGKVLKKDLKEQEARERGELEK